MTLGTKIPGVAQIFWLTPTMVLERSDLGHLAIEEQEASY